MFKRNHERIQGSSVHPGRIGFLDGLRGLAAVQVVLLHYCAAFLPGLGIQNVALIHYGWENAWLKAPLFFLLDGTFAVYVFFAISGTVLSLAYEQPSFGPVRAIGQRIVRLGLPMAVALTFGAGLLRLLPEAHGEAAILSGSAAWLGSLYKAPYTLTEVMHQAVTSSMFLGYKETSLLPQAWLEDLSVDSLFRSLDPPLWTLHIEFWGSILIAGLAAMRRILPPRIAVTFAILLTLASSRHAFLAFMVGHLFALAHTDHRWHTIRSSSVCKVIGVFCVAMGIWSCTNPLWPWLSIWLAMPDPFRSPGPGQIQSLYAAVVFFTGIMILPRAHGLLETRFVRWLGRISFGLYLTHFPILFTVASASFVALRGPMHYGGAALAAFVIGMPLSLLAAEIFTRLVDQPAVRLSRLLSRR